MSTNQNTIDPASHPADKAMIEEHPKFWLKPKPTTISLPCEAN
jgi:hypothetical protein